MSECTVSKNHNWKAAEDGDFELCDECGRIRHFTGSSDYDFDRLSGSKVNPREQVLNEAKIAVMKDRNLDYGDPEDNFRDIAAMMNIMWPDTSHEFTSVDAAIVGILIKISRLKTSPIKMDHWVDIAGYAACGWDCVVSSGQVNERNAQGQLDFEGSND